MGFIGESITTHSTHFDTGVGFKFFSLNVRLGYNITETY